MILHCPNPACRSFLNVAEKFADKDLRCPACKQTVKVPASIFAEILSPDLTPAEEDAVAVQRAAAPAPAATPASTASPPALPPAAVPAAAATAAAGLSSKMRCPSCNTMLKAGTVLCVQCGYHVAEGKKLETQKQLKGKSAENEIWLDGTKVIAGACYFFGAVSLLIALPFVINLQMMNAFMPGYIGCGFIVFGYFFAKMTYTEVAVAKRKDHVECQLTYRICAFPVSKPVIRFYKLDKLVLGHDTPAYGIIILLCFTCVGLFPGILWWFLLLRKRTFLQIYNADTGGYQDFSIFWDEGSILQLVDTIRDVEYVELDRK